MYVACFGFSPFRLLNVREYVVVCIVMRSDGNMRLVLNANLYDGMLVELALEKAIRFLAIDPENNNKMQTYLLRVCTSFVFWFVGSSIDSFFLFLSF